MTGMLHDDQYIFLIISRPVLLRMRNMADKNCRENQNSHFMSNNFFSFENRAVYEILWKNTVDPGRPQMTIWRMRIACWVPKATNTHPHRLCSRLHLKCDGTRAETRFRLSAK